MGVSCHIFAVTLRYWLYGVNKPGPIPNALASARYRAVHSSVLSFQRVSLKLHTSHMRRVSCELGNDHLHVSLVF